MLKTIALMAAGLVMATTATASAHTTSVDKRQSRQADRIEYGRQTGKITWTEGLKLRAQQRRIARVKMQFLRDGRLDREERRILRAMQNDASQHIYHEAHDWRRRAPWAPRVGR